jgi:transposase
LLALAEIYEGGTRTKAARVGGVGLQTVRDWVVRFNAHGPEALVDGKAPGNVCKLSAHHREALLALVESGPIPACPWGGALAAERPGTVALGRVPD